MTLVTIEEARERLPELIGRVAAGEKVVFAEDGKWVAALAAPPPMPPTLEEELARQSRVKEAIKEMVRWQIEDGFPPPPESRIWGLFAEGEGGRP